MMRRYYPRLIERDIDSDINRDTVNIVKMKRKKTSYCDIFIYISIFIICLYAIYSFMKNKK